MKLSDFAKKLINKNGSINNSYFLPTGEQYCPDCHTQMAHREDGYFECEICYYSITDEEAANGEGHPTLESTYEAEIYSYDELEDYRKPVECTCCDGPYPHCRSTCSMIHDNDDY